MAQAIIEKAVDGKFPIGLKYYPPDLDAAETISSVTAAVSPTGLTLGTPAKSGNEVSVEISAGTVNNIYKVQFKVTTSGGKIFNHPTRDSIVVKIVY